VIQINRRVERAVTIEAGRSIDTLQSSVTSMMSGRPSPPSEPGIGTAPGNETRPGPGQNRLRAGEQQECLYFLTAGIVAKYYMTESGESAEFAIVGSEGVIGIAAFLGGESMPNRAVVISAGHAYRLRTADLPKGELTHGPLANLLLRYTQALMVQAAQTVACNQRHSVDQRLCRWILSCLDRLPSNELAMTQETIAEMLGVRREGVTEAMGNLQKAGLIGSSRGRIAALDRPRLEARACECYAAVKREYDRLLRAARHRRPPR
jgi:CRP-like cAMP-binding protein